MALVQAVITDPNKLFGSSYFDLENQLEASPRRIIRLFIEAVTKTDWVSQLSTEKQEQLSKKLSLVLPSHTPYDCLEIFRSVFRNLELPSLRNNFTLQMWMLNRGLVLQNLRYDFRSKLGHAAHSVEQLYLFAIHQDYQHSSSSTYLKLLLKEGIALSGELKGEDLLSIVSAHGTAEELQLTLDYYRLVYCDYFREFLNDRMNKLLHQNLESPGTMLTLIRACQKSRLEPDQWIKKIDWIKHPTCFPVVMRWLDKETQRTFYQAHGLNLLILSALKSEGELNDWAERMVAVDVDPCQLFPKRKGTNLTSIEELLLMLGYRDACVRIVKKFGGDSADSIKIPEGDTFYTGYVDKAAHINLRNLHRAVESGMAFGKKRGASRKEALNKWGDNAYLAFTDKFLRAAFIETAFIFRDAYEKSGRDFKKMEKLLNNLRDDGPHYLHRFFYRSFVDTYHKARAYTLMIPGFFTLARMKRKDEKPFFTPGNVQNDWRLMYNSLQFLLQLYPMGNLREAYYDYLEPDFGFRVKKDEERVIGFPSSKPLILTY